LRSMHAFAKSSSRKEVFIRLIILWVEIIILKID
jgi:hypothetical protein